MRIAQYGLSWRSIAVKIRHDHGNAHKGRHLAGDAAYGFRSLS